jgi:multiple sugar transport system ATP-binding protein
VAIGRALVREAQVFLFDEPLSNLDAQLRTELRRELKQLHRELGATMIYVTHDQVEAMTLASRVAVMRSGRIQQIGAPAEVYAQPANMFVAGFLGSPSMNFIEGRLAGPSFQAGALSLPLPAAPGGERPAVLGIRPEHMTLVPPQTAMLQAEVTLVEPMGSHLVVWLDLHGHRVAAEVAAVHDHAVGATVGVALDLSRASLFDPASQNRL